MLISTHPNIDKLSIINFIVELTENPLKYENIGVYCTDKKFQNSPTPTLYLSHVKPNKDDSEYGHTTNTFLLQLNSHNISCINELIIHTYPGIIRIYNNDYTDNILFKTYYFFNMSISCRVPMNNGYVPKAKEVITIKPFKLERYRYDCTDSF